MAGPDARGIRAYSMRWPRDGAAIDSIWDVRDRLAALIDPWASLRIRAIWIFQSYMRPRKVRW